MRVAQVARAARVPALFSDPRSFLRYCRLLTGGGRPATVAVRALDGARVQLRPHSSDALVLWETFGQRFHVPPVDLAGAKAILDLGANIGLTAAHYAVLCPNANVVAVEMDARNAELARANTERWRDRVTVINAAAWWEPTELSYDAPAGEEYGFRVDAGGSQRVQAVAVSDLVAELGHVDFVKMDIEGAEREVLAQDSAWAERVSAIQVETHAPYTVGECEQRLRELGFATSREARHGASVNGTASR
jgi:FkbM family methyltransferase